MSLTSEFIANPLDFAKRYSICPPHGVEMETEMADLVTGGTKSVKVDYKGDRAQDLTPDGKSTGLESIGYARVMRKKKVGYVELFNDARDVGNNEGRDAIRMRTKFSPFGEAEPVYFLPWDDRGVIVKLRIPAKENRGTEPDVFFTAAINGCSVFIQGDPDEPTVYHAGGPTGIKDPNEAARLWRHALMQHIKSSATAQARGRLEAEVNKTHYISTPGTSGNSSTPAVDAYEKELKSLLDKKGSFQITRTFPWGCIFGIRSGANWAFYLQENATVYCDYVSKKSVRTMKYAKPVRLSKIYPGGSSCIASMSHTVPVKIS